MTRLWRERIHDWRALRVDVWYLLGVVSLDKVAAPPAIRAVLESLDKEHAGRTHVAVLPVPVRPGGLAADFFRACGVEVVAGGTVTPKAVLGKVVRAQFARTASGDAWQIARFALAEDQHAHQDTERRS